MPDKADQVHQVWVRYILIVPDDAGRTLGESTFLIVPDEAGGTVGVSKFLIVPDEVGGSLGVSFFSGSA